MRGRYGGRDGERGDGDREKDGETMGNVVR
jgi:hypothetical protein